MVETGLRFGRLKAFFTVCCIVVPILVTIIWLHCSSLSYLLVEFSNINIFFANNQNFTAIISNEADPAIGIKVKGQSVTPHTGQKAEDNLFSPTKVDDDSKLLDEGSCLSRHESHLYRKASPHKHSTYLKSKLNHYEHLHRSCSSSFSFIRNQSDNTNSNNKHASDKNCKYIIWTPMDGLGNRILSLVSAFLYALLTDRVLLVKFESDMDGLFCEPFPNSSWLLPTGDFPHHHWEGDQTVLHLRHTNDDHYDFFHCLSTQDLLHNVHVLIWQSNQYFVPALSMIPSFRQDLTQMFQEKDTIFHLLGHYLLHPSDVAWKFISNFYQTYLSMARQKIGLQISVFDTHREPHQVVLNKILACTSKHNLLPQSDETISAASPIISQNYNNISKAVLVISLYSEYGNKLKAMYMGNNTSLRDDQVIIVNHPSHEVHQNSTYNKYNMKAWTEMYLLSLCDVLITSSYSTFGYVVQSLGGLKPWILKNGEVPDSPCERAMSMEPCFHYPSKRDCSSNTIINITSFFPHTRHCEDFGSGVKLIN